MHYVRLEKINRKENICKFYNLYAASDIFGDYNLTIEKGRIGQPPEIFVRASGTEEFLLAMLAVDAKTRIGEGYSVIDFMLPSQTRMELENHARSLRKILRASRGRGNIYFDLAAVAELCGGVGATDSLLAALSTLKDEADPQRRKKRASHQPSGQLSFEQSHEALRPIGTTSSDPRREVLRCLAGALLEDDPRTLEAVLRSLSPPSHVAGENIVFFAGARKNNQVMRLSLFEVLSNNPGLLALAHALAENGIRTLGQLVRLEVTTLVHQYAVTPDALDELDIACGRYGLQLGMSKRETGT
jgi:hypothetical protein